MAHKYSECELCNTKTNVKIHLGGKRGGGVVKLQKQLSLERPPESHSYPKVYSTVQNPQVS